MNGYFCYPRSQLQASNQVTIGVMTGVGYCESAINMLVSSAKIAGFISIFAAVISLWKIWFIVWIN